VRAGEASGQLGQVLEEISSNMRRMREAREKIRSALIYPCLVVLLACGVLALLLSVLFPNLAPIFEASGTPLPGPLQMSQAVGAFFGDWWAFLGIGFLVSLLIVARLFRQPAYKQWLDQALLRLPLLGPLLAGIELSRAFRLLGVQLSHGVAHLDALRITGATVRNSHLACLLAKARDQVQEGASLSNSLAGEVFVPPVANQLIVAGETAGRLPAALLDISRILDTETQSRIDRLLTLLAPSLTILVGGIIGLMIWSVMGAVLSVNDIAAR
jgi:general secretion pathway protein F